MALRLVFWLLAAAASIAGCSPESRNRVLVLLFEEGPGDEAPAAPVVRSPRHPPPATPTPTPVPDKMARPGADRNGPAAFRTWDDVVRLLPKNQVGKPDWVRALDEKVIAPRPGIAAEAQDAEVVALDVELTAKSDPAFNVTFSHQKHGSWLACTNCHTGMFEMKAGATPMTAAEVHSGRYCAACHGTVAFDIVTGCPLCHLRNLPKDPNGRVDWSRALAENRIAPHAGRTSKSAEQPSLDLDVALTSKTQPTITSVFSHTAHTQWLACANCHPRLFPMEAKGADVSADDMHSRRRCGACHGPVAFGITNTCERCHPALAKARQHQQVFDLDVQVPSKSQPTSTTIFSHTTHRFVECPSCHTNLFEPTAAPAKMTMADLSGGKYCAVCHGKVASDLITQCQRCHAALGNTQ